MVNSKVIGCVSAVFLAVFFLGVGVFLGILFSNDRIGGDNYEHAVARIAIGKQKERIRAICRDHGINNLCLAVPHAYDFYATQACENDICHLVYERRTVWKIVASTGLSPKYGDFLIEQCHDDESQRAASLLRNALRSYSNHGRRALYVIGISDGDIELIKQGGACKVSGNTYVSQGLCPRRIGDWQLNFQSQDTNSVDDVGWLCGYLELCDEAMGRPDSHESELQMRGKTMAILQLSDWDN